MPLFFLFERKRDSRRVRDLKPGDRVGDRVIDRLELLDGRNGERPMYIRAGGPSAVAIRVHFRDGDPAIAHPDDEAPAERLQ